MNSLTEINELVTGCITTPLVGVQWFCTLFARELRLLLVLGCIATYSTGGLFTYRLRPAGDLADLTPREEDADQLAKYLRTAVRALLGPGIPFMTGIPLKINMHANSLNSLVFKQNQSYPSFGYVVQYTV